MCVFLLSYAFSPVLAVSQFCIDVMVADQVTPFLGHLCNKQITSLHFFFPLLHYTLQICLKGIMAVLGSGVSGPWAKKWFVLQMSTLAGVGLGQAGAGT